MTNWSKGRGLLGPLKPLIGEWRNTADGAGESAASRVPCTRVFRTFGKGWIELDARWATGEPEYREIAIFGPLMTGELGFFSFTNDGKRSKGRLADGSDVHPDAISFEAEMAAGPARMIYWPNDDGEGFQFAVESKTKKGWNRFLRHVYRPA